MSRSRAGVALMVPALVLGTSGSASASALPLPAPPPGLVIDSVYPTTTLPGAPVDFYGYVSPVVHGQRATVQRLVHGRWTVISHVAPTATGGLAFRERAPHAAGGWTLRVTRAASPHSRALVSKLLRLRVVSTTFALATSAPSTVPARSRLTVTGRVAPATSGHVELERRTPFGGWVPWADARMSSSTTFTIVTTPLPPGQYVFRALKNFSPTVAAGAGKPFLVTATG